MSKISFKTTIRERYKGRGNCWIKIPKSINIYNEIFDILKNKENSSDYITDIEREGFAWIRFVSPSGNESNPNITCEIRYQGSKIAQPDTTITISDVIAKDLPLLGNTPFKMDLEIKHIKPKKTKVVKPKKKKRKEKDNVVVNETKMLQESFEEQIANEIDSAKEAALSLPTTQDLIQWKEFLAEEGLLEDAA